MLEDLIVNSNLTIPKSEFQVQYVRSPGPGGQNVNKVATKAIVHWAVYQSPALAEPVKHRLMLAQKNRINQDGQLVVSSHENRTQQQNLAACMGRIQQMILAALHPPKKRKPTKPTKGSQRRRLTQKREKSQKKQRRSDKSWRNE